MAVARKKSVAKPKTAKSPAKTEVPLSPEDIAKRKKLIREVCGIILGLLSLFVLICIIFPDKTGNVGNMVNYAIFFWFGKTSYILPAFVLYAAITLLLRINRLKWHWLAIFLFLLAIDISIITGLSGVEGGIIGNFISIALSNTAGVAGAYIFSIGLAIILIMILTQITLKQAADATAPVFSFAAKAGKRAYHFISFKHDKETDEKLLKSSFEKIPDLSPLESTAKNKPVLQEFEDEDEMAEDEEASTEPLIPAPEIIIPAPSGTGTRPLEPVVAADAQPKKEPKLNELAPQKYFKYKLPSLDFLHGVEKEGDGTSARDYSELLEETLANFGVDVKVINKVRGPTVTRYELQPARGVKVKKVTNLANDIALALAAYSIRIEAPIPGKAAIGIEVPNHRIDPVFLKDILYEAKYKKQPLLSLALGKDIAGKPIMDDLLKMPHFLIAGATGSGKSVCINCVIASMLFKATPYELQMVMIDPKRVELSLFEGIPHLVDIKLPGGKKIITDPKAATMALKTVSEIMDQRYEDFVALKVRNIKEFNEKAEEPIPYIVVVIDELADLMMVSSSTVEQYICRIAQLGRASGIHLIVATQRPSVDVITGLIKANIPSRVAFAVSSQVDSRTILDRVGAEKLLGKGDMLYSPVDASDPRRIQGAYVSGDEIEKLVDFWRQQPPPHNAIPIEIDEIGDQKPGGDFEGDQDPLIPDAIDIIRSSKQASVSNLQRKMKIGYARAGRIMDQLENMGVVGAADGSKPRKILLPGFNDIE